MSDRKSNRNTKVYSAIISAIGCIDSFLNKGRLHQVPTAEQLRVCEDQLEKPNSVKVASLFLAFYSLADEDWDCNRLPIGLRGEYGDKLLGKELKMRRISFAITAFGENLGWKGNAPIVRLENDPKFQELVLILSQASAEERHTIANFMASRFAQARHVYSPLPPVGDDVLTFARAKDLFFKLIDLKSEGYIQQFLITALLTIHRKRYSIEVQTHHPHAADTYDETAGDIEEFLDGKLIGAYEVTARPDWKRRISDIRSKMDRYNLSKYIIVASNVNTDYDLSEPARLIAFLEPYERDIAVVDILDLITVMVAELRASELVEAVNHTYDLLERPKLGARRDFVDLYKDTVKQWLAT